MRVGLKYKGKKFSVDAKPCGFFQMGRGLTFKSRESAKALLFDIGEKNRMALTSIFVFFPFVAIWLDKNNKIINKELIKPFRFSIRPKKSFDKIIEIPVNKEYMKIVKLLVGD